MHTTTQQDKRADLREEQQQHLNTRLHVVVIGAGFGGLEVAKALGKQALEVTVLDHNNFHLFQPMLYQVASAGLAADDIATPIRSIMREHPNIEVLMAEVTGIDVEQQRVVMEDQRLSYDYLVIATGASSNYFGHPEWERLAPGMKTLNDAVALRSTLLTAFEAAEREHDEEKRKALLTFVLVGGGPTGVELAGALAELARKALVTDFRHIYPSEARIVLVEGEKRVLPSFPASLTHKVSQRLRAMGVEIFLGVHVTEVTPSGVNIEEQHINTKNVIWTAGVKASPAGQWLHANVDHDGRVKVQANLSVPGCPNIFVIGDTALVVEKGKSLPGLAPVAIQEGRYVASVIACRVAGQTAPRPFHYFDKGTLATVGRAFGVVAIGPLRFTGFLGWLTWLFVHILFLISTHNRIIVLLQYAWSYFTFQRGARVILPGGHVRKPT